jgi:hypothetical protein
LKQNSHSNSSDAKWSGHKISTARTSEDSTTQTDLAADGTILKSCPHYALWQSLPVGSFPSRYCSDSGDPSITHFVADSSLAFLLFPGQVPHKIVTGTSGSDTQLCSAFQKKKNDNVSKNTYNSIIQLFITKLPLKWHGDVHLDPWNRQGIWVF